MIPHHVPLVLHHVPLVLHPVQAEQGEDPVEGGADVGRARRRADVGLAELQPARAVRPGGELYHLLRYIHPEHRVEPADTAAVRGSRTIPSDTSTPSTEWNLPTQPRSEGAASPPIHPPRAPSGTCRHSRGQGEPHLLRYIHPEHRVKPADTAAVRGSRTTSLDMSIPSTEWNLPTQPRSEGAAPFPPIHPPRAPSGTCRHSRAAVRGSCTISSDMTTPSTEWNLSADEHGEQANMANAQHTTTLQARGRRVCS